jgi:hypothetical protein
MANTQAQEHQVAAACCRLRCRLGVLLVEGSSAAAAVQQLAHVQLSHCQHPCLYYLPLLLLLMLL